MMGGRSSVRQYGMLMQSTFWIRCCLNSIQVSAQKNGQHMNTSGDFDRTGCALKWTSTLAVADDVSQVHKDKNPFWERVGSKKPIVSGLGTQLHLH